MPKYRDKMRLKCWVAEQGGPDDFRQWLILQGYSFDIVTGGLESFVVSWEESVQGIIRYGSSCTEEWLSDIWSREILHQVMCHASIEEKERFLARIEVADRIFKEITEKNLVFSPWGSDEARNTALWWRFRWPLHGFP
jgi:hypothetical protein